MTKTGQDYEICPYATFSLPGGTNSTQTMDYSMQFQTFSQQECYAGQPRPVLQDMVAANPTRITIHEFEQSPAAHHVHQLTARLQGHLRALQMA
jgi:hypothetical protein